MTVDWTKFNNINLLNKYCEGCKSIYWQRYKLAFKDCVNICDHIYEVKRQGKNYCFSDDLHLYEIPRTQLKDILKTMGFKVDVKLTDVKLFGFVLDKSVQYKFSWDN